MRFFKKTTAAIYSDTAAVVDIRSYLLDRLFLDDTNPNSVIVPNTVKKSLKFSSFSASPNAETMLTMWIKNPQQKFKKTAKHTTSFL